MVLRALLCAAVAAGLLSSCAPITCRPGQFAKKQVQCPPCPTIENPPPGYCPCSTSWGCVDEPAVAAERAKAAQARAREERERQEKERNAQRAALDAAAAEQRRSLALENERRWAAFVADAGTGASCPPRTWPKLAETLERLDSGLPSVREFCEPVPAVAVAPKVTAPSPPTEQQRLMAEARLRAASQALVTARAKCAPRCSPTVPGEIELRCSVDGGVTTESWLSCDLLPTDEQVAMLQCGGTWLVRRVCPPPPRPGCHAGRNQCCQPDGGVVGACGPIASPGCVGRSTLCPGPGGWCEGCR